MCEANPVVSVAYARRFSSNGRACSAGGATSGSEPRMVVREPVTSRCTVWRRSCLPPVVIDIAFTEHKRLAFGVCPFQST